MPEERAPTGSLGAGNEGRPIWVNASLFAAALAASALVYAALPGLEEAPRRMAAIFAAAVVLWVSEAVPLFATSLGVIVAETWWLAVPRDLGAAIDYKAILSSIGSPIIFLFLGGFILAKAVRKEGIDVQLAAVLLRPFGQRPAGVLAGVMLVTALFSMFMSNTATTAMMIALIAPLARQVPRGDRFQKGLVLAVPFAANLGGIGTPIGTPPNAIALQAMNARGLEVNFFQWMFFATPLLIGALVVMWFFLLFLFRPRDKTVEVAVQASFTPSFNALTVYATFALTVGLWLSSPWLNSLFGLNIPNAVVAVVPAAVLTMTRIIGREDFNQLEWDVLFLIAGGIALGKGLSLTGLDKAIVEAVPAERMSLYVLTGACCLLVVGFGTVMSHTVATTLVVPLAMAVATGMAGGVELQVVPIMVAVASSFAVSLPISTPPNAIAYASGLVTTRDIMSVGVVTSILATILVVVTGPPTVEFLLRLVT